MALLAGIAHRAVKGVKALAVAMGDWEARDGCHLESQNHKLFSGSCNSLLRSSDQEFCGEDVDTACVGEELAWWRVSGKDIYQAAMTRSRFPSPLIILSFFIYFLVWATFASELRPLADIDQGPNPWDQVDGNKSANLLELAVRQSFIDSGYHEPVDVSAQASNSVQFSQNFKGRSELRYGDLKQHRKAVLRLWIELVDSANAFSLSEQPLCWSCEAKR